MWSLVPLQTVPQTAGERARSHQRPSPLSPTTRALSVGGRHLQMPPPPPSSGGGPRVERNRIGAAVNPRRKRSGGTLPAPIPPAPPPIQQSPSGARPPTPRVQRRCGPMSGRRASAAPPPTSPPPQGPPPDRGGPPGPRVSPRGGRGHATAEPPPLLRPPPHGRPRRRDGRRGYRRPPAAGWAANPKRGGVAAGSGRLQARGAPHRQRGMGNGG